MVRTKAKSNNRSLFFVRANKTKFGGAENYLTRLSASLSKQNIGHTVLNSPFPKFFVSWMRALLFNLYVSLIKKDKFYFSLERITCPDIYRAGDGVHKIFIDIGNKSKINPLNFVYLFLEKRCFRNAKHIIANSKMIKDQIVQVYDIDSNKISVVYNGIEEKDANYTQSFDKLSREFLLKKHQPILLYVGSGFKRKGVEEFLRIVSMLEMDNIKAFVIGKEKKMKHYQQLARKLNIGSQVIFTGPREDVDDFYSISDIFLFPTHYEPFSNVVLEAMNFGNAIFTTRQNGAKEVLDNYFIMNKPEDFSIVSNIYDLLNNRTQLEKIKKENRVKSKQFSIEKNLSETLKIINEVIN